ncbi:MAG TPA: hypothetical protein DCZ95_11960 [Verrucomicrobia bacterium]|nr:MAG: hypothetical protein A2X46_14010 [Lentisphaerae bacterium GWF2_57_35]HBA84799.1 hypothetical protein [Verrucomicrobiota bacterium]
MARKILFLQLPQLDNDVSPEHENTPLAACYLQYALQQSSERAFYRALRLRPADEELDDAHLLRRIVATKPDLIACTLYLWNIERTLDLIARLKEILPRLVVLAGGPEVARDHPFLFRRRLADVAAIGEGEPVIAEILRAIRLKKRTDFQNVAWLVRGHYRWGKQPRPEKPLREMLPPPSWLRRHARTGDMACLETTRGCPMHCAYCSYNQQRTRHTSLTAKETLAIIRKLKASGVNEIRFIDPTFNANPAFDEILQGMGEINHDQSMKCFAELRADRLTLDQARALARAGFVDIEVGVQSLNPSVLRTIHRPLSIAALDRGIRFLAAAGIQVTLDLMYGLPGQTLKDIKQAVLWATGRRRVRVQCLQTLLLPGTELRQKRQLHALEAEDRPPYSVLATDRMPTDHLAQAEAFIEQAIGAQYDCPAQQFVGRNLPDLFPEQVDAPQLGQTHRRAMIFRGSDLFVQQRQIAIQLQQAVAHEPHILWQFVLAVEQEEPLDLLELLIQTLQQCPRLPLDHFLGLRRRHLLAGRRLFIQLKKGRRFSRSWTAAAEEVLRSAFH